MTKDMYTVTHVHVYEPVYVTDVFYLTYDEYMYNNNSVVPF